MQSYAAAGGASALLAAAALLAGCGSDAPQPAAATEGEQRALADAAEMLGERPAPAPSATATATGAR